jgi:hypothetical protein
LLKRRVLAHERPQIGRLGRCARSERLVTPKDYQRW